MISFNSQNKVTMLMERDYNCFHFARVEMEAWKNSMIQLTSHGWWWGGLGLLASSSMVSPLLYTDSQL